MSNLKTQTGKLQFWAVTTSNGRFAMLCAGSCRDTADVIRGTAGYGFVIDVYPNEVRRYERDFARQRAAVLGKFATTAEAYACLERWTAVGTA